jgi:nicotinate-nucleotide adenylyltransferase
MLAASIAGDPRLAADDCDLRRGGVSYTADTIADIRRRYCPDGKIGLIIGDDLLSGFMNWRRADEILQNADIIMATRNYPPSGDQGLYGFDYTALDNEPLPVSSSMVRERVAAGKSWRFLVPDAARLIIEDRGLYGLEASGGAFTAAFIARMEAEVRSLVSPRRFIHSRNTGLLCRDWCAFYGLDSGAGYLAGTVHDICKSFPAEELFALAERDGGGISPRERANPNALLHGRAGAVLLRERYGIRDAAVLEAARCHTVGAEGMGDLAKIVLMADKIEPSRKQVEPRLREVCAHPPPRLIDLFALVLEGTVDFIRSQGRTVFPETLALLESAKQEASAV